LTVVILKANAVAQHIAAGVLASSCLRGARLAGIIFRSERLSARKTNHQRSEREPAKNELATPGRGSFRYSRHRCEYRHDAHKPI